MSKVQGDADDSRMERMKVWVISKGTYSAYRVVGVVSSLDRAKSVSVNPEDADGWLDYNEPEEFELDTFRTDAEMQAGGYRLWSVTFDRDGSVTSVSGIEYREDEMSESTDRSTYEGNNGLVSFCDFPAKSKEDAVKIASEYRAVYLMKSGVEG